jgi:hypothetical protein
MSGWYKISGEVEIFPQFGGWHYVRVPEEIRAELFAERNGFIPVQARIGASEWTTSIMPSGSDWMFVALKSGVRKAERIEVGDRVALEVSAP